MNKRLAHQGTPNKDIDTKEQEQLNTHHAHTQQANKVLSAAASTEDSKKVALLTVQVAELQDNLMEMSSLVGKMRDNQY
jgi:hypothetical protein